MINGVEVESVTGHYTYNHFVKKERKWLTINDDKLHYNDDRKRNEEGTIYILEKITSMRTNEIMKDLKTSKGDKAYLP